MCKFLKKNIQNNRTLSFLTVKFDIKINKVKCDGYFRAKLNIYKTDRNISFL